MMYERAFAFAATCLFLAAGSSQAGPDPQAFAQIENGRYLATAGDCVACHTAPGGKPFAGGLRIETPFGVLVSPNLTPDRATGIGAWSDEDFYTAMHEGTGPDGKHLYPAFPYPWFTHATRADVMAIRAYLNTLEPVGNSVNSNLLPFPFNIRETMLAWNWLYFTAGEFQPNAGKSGRWNRGAYLVEGLAHCGACHTPKNFLGADKTAQAYQGSALQDWYAPNLTNGARKGLGGWSTQDIVDYLKTGHNRMTAATGPMAEVVTRSTSHLTDADLDAIAAYLKDTGSENSNPTPVSAEEDAMKSGSGLFLDNCAACHAASGSGVPGLFPTLAKSPAVQSSDATSLIRVVLQGAHSVATNSAPTGPAMPAFGWKLTDPQVAAVLTYIRNSWSNAAPAISASDVKSLRQKLQDRAASGG
jgi:mono/diheme cytochrome c family protein